MAERSTRDTVCVGVHSLRDRGVAYRRHHLPPEVGNDHSDSAAQWWQVRFEGTHK